MEVPCSAFSDCQHLSSFSVSPHTMFNLSAAFVDPQSVLLGVVPALLLAAVSWVIYQRYFSPLARIPGPTSARWGGVGSWMSKRALAEDFGWSLAAE